MTREEASRRIQDLRRKVEKPRHRTLGWLETWIYKEDIKALDMAIKALEQEPRWIPIVMRKPTDEEKAEYLAQNGEELCYMLENEMPLNGQEVLVSIGKFVSEDVFDEDFYNFENNDIENVDAWMPKPKPYSEVKE